MIFIHLVNKILSNIFLESVSFSTCMDFKGFPQPDPIGQETFSQRTKLLNFVTLQVMLCAKSLKSYLTLCDTMNCSPPGSPVHEILQTITLEWVTMPSSRGSSPPGDQTRLSYVFCIGRWVLYRQRHLGSPYRLYNSALLLSAEKPQTVCEGTAIIVFQQNLFTSTGSLLSRPHGLQPIRISCSWDFLGKNTGVDFYFILQGIFQTQGSKPCYCISRLILYC